MPPPNLMPEHTAIVTTASNLDLSFLEPVLSRSLTYVNIPELLEEYKKFLTIKVIAKDTTEPLFLSPSGLIGQVCQAYLLSTARNREACTAMNGCCY